MPDVFPYGIAPLSGKIAGNVNMAAQSLLLTDIQLSNQDIRQLQVSGTIAIKQQQLDSIYVNAGIIYCLRYRNNYAHGYKVR